MADGAEISAEDVRSFIAANGGKVTNLELVKRFKKFLSSSDSQAEARQKFKDLVNAVAIIKQEDGVKYLILKDTKLVGATNSNLASNKSVESFKDSVPKITSTEYDNSSNNGSLPSITHSHSSPCIPSTAMVIDTSEKTPVQKLHVPTSQQYSTPVSGPWSTDLPPGHVPQPPPCRKNSAREKENRATKFEESVKLHEEKENQGGSPRHEEIKVVVSPGNVKEKTQKLNRMAHEGEAPEGRNGLTGTGSNRKREHRGDKVADYEETCSVSTLDPRRREWMIKACQCDYHELLRLLKEEPKLANSKDLNSYNALHWAAKHGNLDVIKLIAGTHKVNTNAKTNGGYTPLHLAAMFGREEIMEILINTYGADPMIRDHSGKRPIQYLPQAQANRLATLFPQMKLHNRMQGSSLKEINLHRIGSLNSKVKKTSVMLAGGKALTRMKSWGSADNIPDRHLMPPPKFFPKKKKSRRQLDYFGAFDGSRCRSGDSDSDSASGLA